MMYQSLTSLGMAFADAGSNTKGEEPTFAAGAKEFAGARKRTLNLQFQAALLHKSS
jgi:hypothetical protein